MGEGMEGKEKEEEGRERKGCLVHTVPAAECS